MRDYDYEKDIYYLENTIKMLLDERQEIIDYINEKCVYDEHLQRYEKGLRAGDIKRLVLKLKDDKVD